MKKLSFSFVIFIANIYIIFLSSLPQLYAQSEKTVYSGKITEFRMVNLFGFAGSRSQVFICLDKHPEKCFGINSDYMIDSGIAEPVQGQEGQYSMENAKGKSVSMKCWEYDGIMSSNLLPCKCSTIFECDAIEKSK